MSAERREPVWVFALIALGLFAYGQHRQVSLRNEQVANLRDTIRYNMAPLVQVHPLQPNIASLAGEVCGSEDCGPELMGWRWAVANKVQRHGDCYGENSAYTLGLAAGCDAYAAALQLPDIPEQ